MLFFLKLIRILLGISLIISGTIKAIDPVGIMFKISDFFSQILQIPQLQAFSFLITVIIIIVEFTLGVMLIANFFPKITIPVTFSLLLIYTIFSAFSVLSHKNYQIALTNIFYLSNKQILLKNILLCLFSFILVIFPHSQGNTLINERFQISITLSASLVIFAFMFVNYTFLPIIQTGPFRKGTNISKLIQNSNPNLNFKTYLYYKNKKNGKIYKFSEKQFPWKDTLHWTWVKTINIPIQNPKYQKINFYIRNPLGKDITDSLLNSFSPVLLIVCYNLEYTNIHGFIKILKFSRKFTEQYFPVAYCLTSSPQKVIDSFIDLTGAYDIEFCHSDPKTLKLMIHANPGIIIIKKGIILMKRSYNNLPNLKKINFYNFHL